MFRYLKFAWIFLILAHYKVDAISRLYSSGGSSQIFSNGFRISYDGNKLYCGNLTCIGAVNCEITKYGANVHEKCSDSNLNVIDQKSYTSSEFSDVELYFGPAYQKQAEEQVRQIIYSALREAFSGFASGNNNGTFQNSTT